MHGRPPSWSHKQRRKDLLPQADQNERDAEQTEKRAAGQTADEREASLELARRLRVTADELRREATEI
jgi:hypothetical protein